MSENDDGHWFVPKAFGLGATPVTWQGWVTVLLFVALVLAIVLLVPQPEIKFGLIVPLTLGFVLLTWSKTRGAWRWRWGSRD